ncbi:somatostatin receptor type 5-like [Pleurodeles waltl]|uniref:somatostatin receptor type 5-like n=1 Tax=Pleurodeles waltl TaxID=8319 RepID=UPI0037094E12
MEAIYENIFGNGSLNPNLNLTDYFSPEYITTYPNIPLVISYFLLSVFGLLGNALVMYIFLRHAKIRTVSNIYIFNMAIGDILLMLVLPFLATQEAMTKWSFGILWCKIILAVESINPIACIFFVTVMSIDRCVVLYRPHLASRWRKPKVAVFLSIAVWIISMLSSVPVILFGTIPEYYNFCQVIWPDRNHNYNYTAFLYYLGFFQPVLLVVVCMLITAVKAQPPVTPLVPKHKGSDRTRMVVVLFLVYVVFWLPLHTFNLFYTMSNIDLESVIGYQLMVHVGTVVAVIPYIKSCIYPIIYCVLSGDFRQCFCCNKREQQH